MNLKSSFKPINILNCDIPELYKQFLFRKVLFEQYSGKWVTFMPVCGRINGRFRSKNRHKKFFRYFFGTSFYKYLHLSATFQKNELEGTSSGVIQSNNNREIIIICDSGIQRIGYHFLYNLGVKIERDKSVKPLPTKK